MTGGRTEQGLGSRRKKRNNERPSPVPAALFEALGGGGGRCPLHQPHLHSLSLQPHLLGPAQGSKGKKSRREPCVQDIRIWETEQGTRTGGTSSPPLCTFPAPTSPPPAQTTIRPSDPFSTFLTPPPLPQDPPLRGPATLPCPPQPRHSPLCRVSCVPGFPVSSAAIFLASASVRPTTQQSSLSPYRRRSGGE